MDNTGNINPNDNVRINVEFEAEDTLAVRLKRLRVEGPKVEGSVREILERQTRGVLGVNYLDGELALIEVDGIAHAVQIRSKKPEDGRFVEVILRKGTSIQVEGKGGAIHLSRENYGKLVETLKALVHCTTGSYTT